MCEVWVSIHAYSREDATLWFVHSGDAHSFNPRVLAGGRNADITRRRIEDEWFQSTRPRGRTRPDMIRACCRFLFCFNPRVLAGGRDFSSIPT